MSGHDLLRASVLARELEFERNRKIERRNQIREAMENNPANFQKVSWFGGIKATARFLGDSVQAAVAQRRMTEAHS